jgi:hypothetical protein
MGSQPSHPDAGRPTPLPNQPTQQYDALTPPQPATPPHAATPPQPFQAPYAPPAYGTGPQPYAAGYAQSYAGNPQAANPYAPNPYASAPMPGHPQGPSGPQAPVSPGALYGFPPPGAAQPMSLTGQMRLFEVDELPPQYKVASGGRWIKIVVAGVAAVAVAAGVTFFIMRSLRETAPTHGSIHVASEPPGATITYDGTRLVQTTPYTIDPVPIGVHHDVKVELAGYKPYSETIDVPKDGSEVQVSALLKPVTGTLRIVTNPDGADILINDQLRGRSPMTLTDIDMSSAKTLELRLKGYRPVSQNLAWPASGEIDVQVPLTRQ